MQKSDTDQAAKDLILIVDDNTTNIDLLVDTLKDHYELCIAKNGLEGLEQANQQTPDLIILDIMMPGMDGYEVCKQLKASPRTKEIPVIFITVMHEANAKTRAFEEGALDYITRPFHSAEVRARVNTQLSLKKMRERLSLQNIILEKRVAEKTEALKNELQERIRTEEERKRLVTALDQVAESISITDTKGTIIYVNPAFEKITGYSKKDAIGQNSRILKSGKHDLSFYQNLWQTISNGGVWRNRFINKRKNGSFYHTEATISAVKNAAGKIMNYVAVKRDVTKEVLLEEQLRQSQKMEAIGTLAGGIAHDFNNIIAAIMGCVELILMETPSEAPIVRSLNKVLMAVNRARDLVKQILSFCRQNEQEQKSIKLNPIIKEVLKLIRASIPSTIEIRQVIEKNMQPVLADPIQMHQLLMNLCANAHHAMQKDGGVLTVTLKKVVLKEDAMGIHATLKPGVYAKLSVSDTGHGIRPEIKEKIFDPYFTTKEKGEGTGMGLAVVHGIVRAHKGEITVESTPQSGSTFHIFLPLIDRKEDKKQEENEVEIATGKGNILLIDDEELLVELGEDILTRLGYQVTPFVSPEKALEAFKKDPDQFDVVITDMTMPKMTGEQLINAMKKIRKDMPVILCSGYSEQLTDEKIQQIGVKAYFMKPMSIKNLSECLKNVFEGLH